MILHHNYQRGPVTTTGDLSCPTVTIPLVTDTSGNINKNESSGLATQSTVTGASCRQAELIHDKQ